MIATHPYYTTSWIETAVCMIPLVAIFLMAWIDSKAGATSPRRGRPHTSARGGVTRVVRSPLRSGRR